MENEPNSYPFEFRLCLMLMHSCRNNRRSCFTCLSLPLILNNEFNVVATWYFILVSRNLLFYFHPICVFLKQLLSFSGELRHFMEECNHDSKGLHDIKTIRLSRVRGCNNVTPENDAGDMLCFPGLVKIQYC